MTKPARKIILKVAYVASFILTVTIVFINFYLFLNKQPKLTTYEKIDEDILYWQDFVNRFPTYRDGYVILTKLYNEKGKSDVAINLIKRALVLDPFSDNVLNEAKVLGISTD